MPRKFLSGAALALAFAAPTIASVASLPSGAVLETMHRVDRHFRDAWPDPGKPIVTNRTRPSNIWTRGVYFEGLMALYSLDRDPAELGYAEAWAAFHHWGLRSGPRTRNADDQCCGQTYLDLYRIRPRPERIAAIRTSLSGMADSARRDDWSWIDAVQMGLPVFAKLGTVTGADRYFRTGHELFLVTRDGMKDKNHPALFNPKDGLWWRDRAFVPPYRTARGRPCYWSRGNGWVFAAMARSIDILPPAAAGIEDYRAMLKAMAPAVLAAQRSDGFWNVDLGDAEDFPGPETSGTALFVYGFAAGVRLGVLPSQPYLKAAERGWRAMVDKAVHPDGFLGFVQGTGKEPADGQPVTYDRRPDFEDFGVGCFLLAGSEMYRPSAGFLRDPAAIP